MCFGSVHILNTSSRGASKTRVMTSSRSVLAVAGMARSGRWMSHRPWTVDHPGRAETVDQHAEALGEERLGERHVDLAAVGKPVEHACRLLDGRNLERHGVAAGRLLVPGRGVGGHQHLVADREPRMHDLLVPFLRHVALGRRALVLEHRLDLAVEQPGVELEGFLAVALEEQIRIDTHDLGPFLRSYDGLTMK